MTSAAIAPAGDGQEPALSQRIAAHIAGLTPAALPPPIRHATRRALLDAIGVMLAASGLAQDAQPYRRHARAVSGQARLIGSEGRSTSALAALANGSLAHALDFGDTFDAGPAHPHAALVPALLALADERPHLDLGMLVVALAAGGDLACRLSLAPARPYEDAGWYPPPLVNLVASAAACARFIGLSADGIRHAMGLAMLQGAFPGEIKYDASSPLRGLREGFVARAAVEAALLAEAGAEAFHAPIEGKAGFLAVYGGGYDGDVMLDGLGTRFYGAEVSFKPWPACRGTHPYIEAALALRPSVPLDRIECIEAETGPVQEMLIHPLAVKARPTRPVEAKFSIPWVIALALVEGEVTLRSFLPDRMANSSVQELADKVAEVRNPAWGREHAASGSLTIRMKDGGHVTHAVPRAAGHPDEALADAVLVSKFVDCAGFAAKPLSRSDAAMLAKRILNGPQDLPAGSLLDRATPPKGL